MTDKKNALSYRWKDSVALCSFVFIALTAFVLIAFDFPPLYPIIAIVVMSILVQVWRGTAFLGGALGAALSISGIWGLFSLADLYLGEYGAEGIGALNLMPANWTWLLLVLYLVLGIPLFLISAKRIRDQRDA